MILKASQRSGATQLAAHLLRTGENDHVELHEVKGFVANDVKGAFREAYAVSRGTKCVQYLFSLSMSPPKTEDVPVAVFEKAIGEIETKLGLTGQPRVVVFHEKQGRRHAHCVWSRIDVESMTTINMPHFKLKLRDVARDLFLKHAWLMPAGLANSAEQDPRNFTREQWEQAKRADKDPRDLQEAFQDCWAWSDSGKAFAQALESRGLYLARGDRRGFVALDVKGEVYSIPKWTGLKTKQVEAHLGDPAALRSVDETRVYIAGLLSGMLGRHLAEAEQAHAEERAPLLQLRATMRIEQRGQRSLLLARQRQRAEAEARRRASRFRMGVRGLWDRLTGRCATIQRENETEAASMRRRDEKERQAMSRAQLADRRQLGRLLMEIDTVHKTEIEAIHREHVAFSQSAAMAAEAECGQRSPRTVQRRHVAPSP